VSVERMKTEQHHQQKNDAGCTVKQPVSFHLRPSLSTGPQNQNEVCLPPSLN
jgi:hypothetical protein